MGLDEAEFLEGKIAHAAYHEQRHDDGEDQRQPGQDGHEEVGIVGHEQHERGHDAGAGGAGESHEETFGRGGHAYVEAGQAQGGAAAEQKGYGEAETAEVVQLPGVGKQAGSHAECHVVGEGVVFDAELAGRAGESRHLAVESVHGGAHENGPGREIELILECENDAEEAGEEAGRGEQIGQNIDAAGNGLVGIAHESLSYASSEADFLARTV